PRGDLPRRGGAGGAAGGARGLRLDAPPVPRRPRRPPARLGRRRGDHAPHPRRRVPAVVPPGLRAPPRHPRLAHVPPLPRRHELRPRQEPARRGRPAMAGVLRGVGARLARAARPRDGEGGAAGRAGRRAAAGQGGRPHRVELPPRAVGRPGEHAGPGAARPRVPRAGEGDGMSVRREAPERRWEVVHLDLSEGAPALPRQGDAGGLYLVFWWRGLPLGQRDVPAEALPMTAARVAAMAAEAVAPAVADRLGPWPVGEAGLADLRGLEALDALGAVCPEREGEAVGVSVVVCTRDRPEPLAACLRALSRQTRPPREVVVVDNAPASALTRRCVDGFPG